MTRGEKVEQLMNARSISVRRLAAELGVAHPTLYSWLKGEKQPRSKDVWGKIADYFGVPLRALLDPTEEIKDYVSALSKPRLAISAKDVRMPKWPPIPCSDWQPIGEETDSEEVPAMIAGDSRITTTVRGDSMSPRLCDGDKIVVQLDFTPRYGRIVLARSADNEMTCKVLRKSGNGKAVLSPINSEHEVGHRDHWEIVGYLVAVLRDYSKGRGSMEWDEGGIAP